MKRCALLQLLLFFLFFAVSVVGAGWLRAQTFSALYSFPNGTNGISPQGLVVSDKTIYGTASRGGSTGNGVVFMVNADGTDFTVLHNFLGGTNDGAYAGAGLVLSGDTLYGTTLYGGSSGFGTVFSISTEGKDFTNLHSFTGDDGANPQATMLLLSNRLYGTTANGGLTGGAVFALNTDGTGFTNLHSFIGGTNEGASPQAGMVVSGNWLYGTTAGGGALGGGTVFALKTDGTGFTNLHSFDPFSKPVGNVSLSGNLLYGTTSGGGAYGNGTVFALNIDGTGFTILHTFDQYRGNLLSPPYTAINRDGMSPNYLIVSGNKLYGTTSAGGYWGFGTIFELTAQGADFQVLYNLDYYFQVGTSPLLNTNTGGIHPNALSLSTNTLYGTASMGGIWANGTVFSLSLPLPPLPPLAIAVIPSNKNLRLSWPADFYGYTLQSTTNLASPTWTPNPRIPVVINGQFTVISPISGTQRFFRVAQ